MIAGIGFQHGHFYHFVFVRHTTSCMVIFVIYIDGILLTRCDTATLAETKVKYSSSGWDKSYLKQHFTTKEMKRLRNFLGIEISYHKYKLVLSQKKYAQDLLEETNLLKYKSSNAPMESDLDL